MLQFGRMKTFREHRLRQLNDSLLILDLTKEKVVSLQDNLKTFAGNPPNVRIPVPIMDFPFEYSHQDPFPVNERIQKDVNRVFMRVFRMAGNHFSNHSFYQRNIRQTG